MVKRRSQFCFVLACFAVAVLLTACTTVPARPQPSPVDVPTVRALEAKAICVALAALLASAPKVDLPHYAVLVGREGKNFDIVFLPDSGPGEENMVGGETMYGAEVHYIISPRTYKILEVHYAK